MATYEVRVRDTDRQQIGVIDGSTFALLELVPRFNRPGAWRLVVPAGPVLRSRLVPGNGVLILRDGVTLLSGPILRVKRAREQGRPVPGMLEVSGSDDYVWIESRVAYPVPTQPANNQGAAAYDTRSGVAETVIKAYVSANAGAGALAVRQVPGLVIAPDTVLGSSVSGSARFDALGDLVRGLATAGGGLGVRVVQVGTSLQVQVYEPVDRSGTAVFGDSVGNLVEWSYELVAPSLTRAIVGGSGEGTGRVFVERGDTDGDETTWGLRAETFIDRRDTAISAELEQAGDEALADGGETLSLAIAPTDTAGLAYGTDYGLGDRVTVVVDGVAMADLVREVLITVSAEGEQVRPVVGTPDATADPRLQASLRQMLARIGLLERRR
jgi:Siphovirus ReqiPepy6 Gp37-like protein